MPREALSELKIVRVGRGGSRDLLALLAERIGRAFLQVIRDIHLVDYLAPPFEEIDAELLTSALELEVGGHILAVTDADLRDPGCRDASYMFGGKDNRYDVAVVSTRRLGSADPARFVSRVVKVALHELGHNFGLVHHYRYVTGSDGGACPMSKGRGTRFGERGYVRAVIDQRGFGFCGDCARALAGFSP